MPRLLTTGSGILTDILILHLISSTLHTVKSHIHCESHRYNVDFNYYWGWKLYAIMVWMHTETSSHSIRRNADCMHTVPEIEVHQSLNGNTWILFLGIACSPYTHNCLHSSKMSFLNVWFKIHSCGTLQLVELSSHNLFSDTSFVAKTFKLFRIKFSQYSNYWELWPCWISTVQG